MKDTKIVFKFELISKLKEKSVRISTIIMLAIIFLITFVPTIMNMFDGGNKKEEVPGSEIIEVDEGEIDGVTSYGYFIKEGSFSEDIIKGYYPFNISTKYSSEEEMREDIKSEKLEKGIILNSITDFKLIANDISMYDFTEGEIKSSLGMINRDTMLKAEGIDPAKVDEAQNVIINSEVETLGKSAAANFGFAYVGSFIIYFVIILYGVSVATSVAREKNDKTMELLITNTSSQSLIWGKVLASLVVSLGQIILIIAVAAIGIMINKHNYPDLIMNMLKESVSLDVIVVYLLFALFGFLLYYFLFAAVGSLVSKVEEVNNATGPIQFIFVGAFMVSMMGMNMPESTMMKVAALFPFSSPLSMFIRYSMTTVSVLELLLGLGILVLTVVGMSYLSIKIYRMGSLNYGNKIGFFKAIGKVFKERID